MTCRRFYPLSGWSFRLFDYVPWCGDVFRFDQVRCIQIFLVSLVPLASELGAHRQSKVAETFPSALFSALYSLGSAVRVRGPLRADGWRAAGPDSAAPAPPAEGAVPPATVEILLLFVKIVLFSSLSKAKWPKGTQAWYCSSPPIYMPVSHHYHTVSIPVALQ